LGRADSLGEGRTVSEYLTETQHFAVFVPEPTAVYVDGAFHNVKRRSRGSEGFWLANHLESVPGLNRAIPEKGKVVQTPDGPTWDKESLFGIIDRFGNAGPNSANSALREHLSGIDLLICDDLGSEAADFIALDTIHSRVILIHAKARTSRGKSSQHAGARRLSAASLDVVCSQADRNLWHLVSAGEELVGRASGWDTPWEGRVKRIRFGAKNSAAALAKIQRVLAKPNVRREVWVVTSYAFSKTHFVAERLRPRAPAWVASLESLLQSTATSVRAAGGNFRLFCAP
jgi:hypothetical protein